MGAKPRRGILEGKFSGRMKRGKKEVCLKAEGSTYYQ